MTSPTEFVLPYDKHKGKTLSEVLVQDRAYVEWLAKKMAPRTETGRQIKQMAKAALAAAMSGTQSPPSNGRSTASAESDPRPRIYSEITRSVILHVEDALDIGKVRVFLVRYQRGEGAQATAAHYVDVADARVLAADLATGYLADKFVDFKGTASDAQPISRVLKLEDRGDGQRAPIVLQVAVGPGQVVGEGAVKPVAKPQVEIAILLTRWQARRLGEALKCYLQAWQTCRLTDGSKAQTPSPRPMLFRRAR